LINILAPIIYRRENIIYYEPGHQFADLREKLENTRSVGFITDKDMSSENNDGQFLRAQFMLAPLILDLNNHRHPWLILDCTNTFKAFFIMKEINARLVYINPYGIILARGEDSQ
jgi:hypothetical protein